MTVAVDQPVPAFTAAGTAGTFALSQARGRPVVLYFYPKDSTPGCTSEARDFARLAPQFARRQAVLLGVSRDSLASHAKFRVAQELPFDLLSDPDEALCQLFGVMKMKNMYGKQVRGIERSTFLIDGEGILRRAWRGLKVPGHAEEVLAALGPPG